MQFFALLRASFSVHLAFLSGVVALLGAVGGEARAQCIACNVSITAANAGNTFGPTSGTVCIGAGVNFTGTINVAGDNVTICNSGTMNGTVKVPNNTAGTVICNGTATGTAAVWNTYVGNNFKDPVTINNYGTWSGGIQPLASGSTVNNKAGSTWAEYVTYAGDLTVVNNGTWSPSLQSSNGVAATVSITNTGTWSGYIAPKGTTTIDNSGTWNATGVNYTGALTINHTAGTWSTGLNPANNSSITVNNGARWTQGFNFPTPGPNRFANAADATATIGGYFGIAAATALENNGAMALNGGMAAIASNSSLTNSSGSTFSVAGEITNSGTIANAGTIAASGNFTNSASGVVMGPAAPLRGHISAGGFTQNAGAFGVVGRLIFCDADQPVNGFDNAGGTIGSATAFCAAPLPVELIHFSAQATKGQVHLRWNTASERNSATFVVERSTTGEAFTAVAETKAQGNSTRAVEYAAFDAKPLPGTSYYRLRQVDRDGAASYSRVVAVGVAAAHQPVGFYPNPASDRLTLDLSTATAAPCEVRLVSLTGRVFVNTMLAGGGAQELPLVGVPAGLYLLHVRTALGSSVQRVEKR